MSRSFGVAESPYRSQSFDHLMDPPRRQTGYVRHPAEIAPECPGCGRLAPEPTADEADRWHVRTPGDAGLRDEVGVVVLCPGCASSPMTRMHVEDEVVRGSLQAHLTGDSVVFPRGETKTLADCTADEVEWLAADALRRVQQAAAWERWVESHG